MNLLRMIPRRFYQVEGREVLLMNFMANFNISEATRTQTNFFIDYRLKPGETARQISERLYEDPELFWTIYITNNITNDVEQWPRADFESWLDTRYTAEQLSEIVGYADPDRNMVDIEGIRFSQGYTDTTPSDSVVIQTFNLTPISRKQLLAMEEEAKRDIRLVDPDYIDRFVEVIRQELTQ